MTTGQPVVQFIFVGGGRAWPAKGRLEPIELPLQWRYDHRGVRLLAQYYNAHPPFHVSFLETARGWRTVDHLDCCRVDKNWVNWHPGPGGHEGTAMQILWTWLVK